MFTWMARIFTVGLFSLFLSACLSRDAVPVIFSIYPPKPVSGEEVKISGTGLAYALISIDGQLIKPNFQQQNELRFTAPEHEAGTYELIAQSLVGRDTRDIVYASPLLANVALGQSGINSDCVINSENAILCWHFTYPDVGPIPAAFSDIDNAKALASGSGPHSCVVLETGAVRCWGDNSYGQLGNGSKTSSATPVDVSGITDAIAAGVGNGHSCALLASGQVQCWGSNTFEIFGAGTPADSNTPVNVIGISNATALASGRWHACALLSGGIVRCWGGYPVRPATTIAGLSNITSISARGDRTCALEAGGTVKCWDYKDSQMDTIPGLSDAVAISVDVNYGCALRATGDVHCWPAWIGDRPLNVPVSNAISIAAGYNQACAVLANGRIHCWSMFNDNRVTYAPHPLLMPAPVTISSLQDVAKVSVGNGHQCALTTLGQVKCWGVNYVGQVGDGTYRYRSSPVDIATGGTVTGLSLGSTDGCLLLSDGEARCWGFRQPSWGTYNVPTRLIDNVVAMNLGDNARCVVLANTELHCEGTVGALIYTILDGDGFPVGYDTIYYNAALYDVQATGVIAASPPFYVTADGVVHGLWPNGDPDIADAIAIDGSAYSACVLQKPGTVPCFRVTSEPDSGGLWPEEQGYNGIENAVSMAFSGNAGCAIDSPGALKCWGNNEHGQRGNGSLGINTPGLATSVIGIDGEHAKAISTDVSFRSACAVLDTGNVMCWGVLPQPEGFVLRI